MSLVEFDIFEKCGRFGFGSGERRIFESSCLFHLIMTDIDLGLTQVFSLFDFKIDLNFLTPNGSKIGEFALQGLTFGKCESSSLTI